MRANFEIELVIDGRQRVLQIAELNLVTDADGYVRYQITLGGMISTVAFDSRYWTAPLLLTAEDVECYYERMHYPEIPKFYVERNRFKPDEIEQIRLAVVQYKIETRN